MKTTDSEFEFFYPVIIEKQLDFEGHVHNKEILLEGHILHGGRLLCGENMEIVKKRSKVPTGKIVKLRDEKTKLCQECSRLYKKNGHSAWTKWVEGKPITPPVKLPPLAKF